MIFERPVYVSGRGRLPGFEPRKVLKVENMGFIITRNKKVSVCLRWRNVESWRSGAFKSRLSHGGRMSVSTDDRSVLYGSNASVNMNGVYRKKCRLTFILTSLDFSSSFMK